MYRVENKIVRQQALKHTREERGTLEAEVCLCHGVTVRTQYAEEPYLYIGTFTKKLVT